MGEKNGKRFRTGREDGVARCFAKVGNWSELTATHSGATG